MNTTELPQAALDDYEEYERCGGRFDLGWTACRSLVFGEGA